ncbi:MAG: hypothetical protein EBZ48_06355, partial [Proteobacteria bacterium]|nr:hypothetical protein [Pseudomonadota bacterium]
LGVSAALAAAAVLGVTAWWWFARSRSATHPDSPGRILRDFAAGLVALFLAAPFSWNHHLVFLIPAVGALLVFTPRAPTIAPALIAAASIVCGVEVPRWCFDWSVHAASALVLWILLLRTDGPCERR